MMAQQLNLKAPLIVPIKKIAFLQKLQAYMKDVFVSEEEINSDSIL